MSDWDQFSEYHWAPYYSLVHFHQFPFWDPYKCGGMPMLANPQSRVLTPFFLIHLLLGPIAGMHLEFPLHLAIAWAGGYVLARGLRLGWLSAVVCASVFPCNSWLFLHFVVGHLQMLSYCYAPWIIAFICLAIDHVDLRWAGLAGLLVALTFGEGNVYAFVFLTTTIGILAVAFAATRRSSWPLRVFLASALFSAGFAAIKLLPTLGFISSRPISDQEYYTTPWQMAVAIFSRDQSVFRTLEFHEQGAYVGIWFGLLALLGATFYFKRAIVWLITAAITLLFSAGGFVTWAPWALLHRLPVFGSLRIATRLLILFALTVAPLVGFGVEAIVVRLKRWGPVIAGLILAFGLVDAWLVDMRTLALGYNEPPVAFPLSEHFRQFYESTGRRLYSVATANMGSVRCYEVAITGESSARGFNQPGYRGEQYLLGGGSVALIGWSPNVISFDVDAPEPTTLVINQNYYPAWHLVEGNGKLISEHGLLAVSLGAGRQRLTLRYRDYRFMAGFAISMLTFGALALVSRVQSARASPPVSRGWPGL